MDFSSFQILARIVANNPQAAGDSFSRSLTPAAVRNAKPDGEAKTKSDGGGLGLYIPTTGAKVWRYRYRIANKPGILTIGSYPEIGLSDARVAHRGARWLVERGIHPLKFIETEIDREKAEQSRRENGTFRAVATAWMDRSAPSLSARTVRHRVAMLEKYVFAVIGERPVVEIRRKELAELLKKIDSTKPETAKHCRLYIKQALDWAVSEELLAGNPTPLTKDVLEKRNGDRSVKHRKAISIRRLGEFIKTVKDAPDSDPLTKVALRLLILSWCRTSEVIGAKWREFDLDAGTWTIPPERMKARKVHTVYLSVQAVELVRGLRDLTGHFDHVFPNRRRPDDHMNRMTLTSWRQRWGFADEMEMHGIRATCSTWANEAGGKYRPDVIEAALAHNETNRVRASYNRAEYTHELRQMWQDWADVCDEQEAISESANVVRMGPKAA